MADHNTIEFQDQMLLALGAQMDALLHALRAVDPDKITNVDPTEPLFAQLKPLQNSIIAIPAQTLEGLAVKVRLAEWCYEGETPPGIRIGGETTDIRTATSIARDVAEMCKKLPKATSEAANVEGAQ